MQEPDHTAESDPSARIVEQIDSGAFAGAPTPAGGTAPQGFDIEDAYVRAAFPLGHVVLLLRPNDDVDARELYWQIADQSAVDAVDANLAPFIVLELATADDAVEYCRRIPIAKGFAIAYSHGERLLDSGDLV